MTRITNALLTILAYGLIAAFVAGMIPLSWRINAWERAHNYPYGKMCNSAFTGWRDQCVAPR